MKAIILSSSFPRCTLRCTLRDDSRTTYLFGRFWQSLFSTNPAVQMSAAISKSLTAWYRQPCVNDQLVSGKWQNFDPLQNWQPSIDCQKLSRRRPLNSNSNSIEPFTSGPRAQHNVSVCTEMSLLIAAASGLLVACSMLALGQHRNPSVYKIWHKPSEMSCITHL